jgi:poly [ADP-ribose] polymerase
MPNVIEQAKYVSADVNENKNRYWYAYLNGDSTVLVEWGRVGASSQSKLHQFASELAAKKFYDKKCKEKESPKKGYRKLSLVESGQTVKRGGPKSDIKKIAEEQIKTDKKSADLISRVVSANVHSIVSKTTITYNDTTGVFSTPCGVVTNEAIDDARHLLGRIGKKVANKVDPGSKPFVNLVNDYLMLIPQNVGRKLDIFQLFPDVSSVSKQNDILDSLEASVSLVSKGDANEPESEDVVFDASLKAASSKDVARITEWYRRSKSRMHHCSHLDVVAVYDLRIGHMVDEFEKKKKSIGNVQEFWHGTRKGNVLSILSKGLLVPPSNASHVTGRLLGDGLYFASCSTKSLNYSYGYWDRSGADQNPMMFIADVAMGKTFEAKNAQYERYPAPGYDSVRARAKKTKINHWQTLQNDEYVVYKTDQINLKYLIEFA